MDKDLQIDTYIKGFHVGFGHIPTPEEIKEIALSVEELLKEGYKPSWNTETNKEVLKEEKPSTSDPVAPQPHSEGTEVEPVNEDWCPIHKVKMKEREGQYGKFYSHAKEIEGKWNYCSGKGYK